MADKKTSIVETAKARYARAKEFYGPLRAQAVADTKFVMGDSENQWQWPEDVYQNRSAMAGKPCLTINITAQHCNQIINSIRQNRPSAKVSPVDGDADKKTALILGGMLRSIQSYSNADTAHDIAAEHSVYGGEGFWRILTDYETPDSFDQIITIKPLVNPQLVYIDPDAIEPDRSDAKWGFIFEDLSKEQVAEEHPGVDASSWAEDDSAGWTGKDKVRRAEYFWCESVPDVLIKLPDGSVTLKSKLPEGVTLAGDTLTAPDGRTAPVAAQRPTSTKVWYWCKLLGGEAEPVDKRIWPGSYLPIITVVGKEVNVNGELVRKGVVRDLKDSARMVNYSYSAAVETVALQNKVPYLASAESIAGFEDVWGAANLENRAYLPYNERDMEGNPLQMPSRQPAATMATAQVQMLQLSVEQMRASSGQQNANFGIRSEAQSGVGIQRLKAQGEIATFHFPDNLTRALSYEAKVILDLIPKLYDTARVVRVLGLDGKETAALLNPEQDQAHTQDIQRDIEVAFNPLVGRYDVTIDTGPSYQTQRQESADALTSLTKSMPMLSQVAGDLVVRAYDFPMADEISERLAKALPPGLKDEEKGGDVPPQVQQQIQQMGQQMDQLTQELHASADKLHELQDEREWKMNELAVKAFEADTKRIAALSTGMNAEQVQALVMQTLQGTMGTPSPSVQIQEDMQENEQAEAEPPGPGQMPTPQPPTDGGFFTPENSPPPTALPGAGGDDHRTAMERLLQQNEAILAHLSKPRQSRVSITKQADGSFMGQRIEE